MSENIYTEPSNLDYVIIKTKESTVENEGIYEATRKAWHAKLSTAEPYKYALSVVQGVVREVYEVEKWQMSGGSERIEFVGHVAPAHIRNWFLGKMIPEKYRVKGLASPFLYKKVAAGEETKEMTLQVPVAPVPVPGEDEEDQIVTPESRPQSAPSKKNFRKYPEKGKISGVCSGLAEYWGMSVTLVRIIFMILFLFGIGLWLYLILAIAMPRE